MSLWQGSHWTRRPSQSTPAIHVSRPSLSGNSSAAASTVSLLSTSSGSAPRRPLNQLNLRQKRRSSSIPRGNAVGSVKSDHDPVKTLIEILGDVPDSPTPEGEPQEDKVDVGPELRESQKADAGGKTLDAWLEELEKNKLASLSKDVEQRSILSQLS
jgi:hypothetical protein